MQGLSNNANDEARSLKTSPTKMTSKRATKCSQGECFKQAKGEGVKMHKLDYVGRSNGWTNRLKRSAGAKFKLMVTEEEMFLSVVLCVWFSRMSGS